LQSDIKIAALLKKQRDTSKRYLGAQYDNTESCQAYYNGSPQSITDRIQFSDTMGKRRRAMVNFNKVQENVDVVAGFMAQNRRQAKYIARLDAEEGQEIYSKYMNALYDFHRENQNADQVESEQDLDMLVGGYGATETDLSYLVGNATTDPNGEIIKVKLDPRCIGWDPKCKDKNLLGSRWALYWDDYDLDDALSLFQGSKADDFEVTDVEDMDQAGYQYNPYGGLYDKIRAADTVEWTSKDDNMVRVYNHQWFEYETFYKADNPLYQSVEQMDAMYILARLDVIKGQIENEGQEDLEVEDMFTFDPKAEVLIFDEKTKGILVKEFGDMIKPVGFKKKCFYTAVYSGEHIFSKFKSISQQGFSIKFKTGAYDETNKIWVGMVNSMMEPQKYYNKALTELMFTIAANSKGGVMVEEDAVEDISDFESKWAKTDSVIKVNSGAISGQKIMQKAQGAVPTGLENIITLSAQGISSAGVDPSFMGNIDKQDMSGILYKRRIRQVISKMAKYFDSITLYQKEDARLHGDLIPVWVENNNGQWVRITGEDQKDQFIQVSEDKMAAEYDVSIQEASQTPEDKQETAAFIGTVADKVMMTDPATGKSMYAEVFALMGLDGDIKNRLTKLLQPQQDTVPMDQFQQLQAQLQEAQSALTQAQVAKLAADTALAQAKAQTEAANTAEKLENAANKGLENDLIRSGNYEKATVSI